MDTRDLSQYNGDDCNKSNSGSALIRLRVSLALRILIVINDKDPKRKRIMLFKNALLLC